MVVDHCWLDYFSHGTCWERDWAGTERERGWLMLFQLVDLQMLINTDLAFWVLLDQQWCMASTVHCTWVRLLTSIYVAMSHNLEFPSIPDARFWLVPSLPWAASTSLTEWGSFLNTQHETMQNVLTLGFTMRTALNCFISINVKISIKDGLKWHS